MSFMVNICFLSGSLEFGDVQGKVCLHDQCPIKTLALSLTSFLFLHLVAGVINHVLCISVGRGLLEVCPWFPSGFVSLPFSPLWILLCTLLLWPIYSVESCELSEYSMELGLIVGTPNTLASEVSTGNIWNCGSYIYGKYWSISLKDSR